MNKRPFVRIVCLLIAGVMTVSVLGTVILQLVWAL